MEAKQHRTISLLQCNDHDHNLTLAAQCSNVTQPSSQNLCSRTFDFCLREFDSTEISPVIHAPSAGEIWGYGLLFVLLVSLSSAIGICFLPLMQRDYYQKILMGMVGLAVGSLCGSAILHLIPKALGVPMETPVEIDAYLFKALTVIAAIYVFFLTERLMKLSVDYRNRQKYEKKDGFLDHGSPTHAEEHTLEDAGHHGHGHHVSDVKTHVHEHDLNAEDVKQHPIKTVAWMVITGDGIVDGLSMGAAFSISILDGIAVSVAVLCEELPHELGDLAILLNAGMSLKKALLYNFVSACTCFAGLIVGILLGELEHASTWIFAIAGGMFLYISLVDMMPELTHSAEEASAKSVKKGLHMLLIQNLGLLCGFAIMFVMARYADSIRF